MYFYYWYWSSIYILFIRGYNLFLSFYLMSFTLCILLYVYFSYFIIRTLFYLLCKYVQAYHCISHHDILHHDISHKRSTECWSLRVLSAFPSEKKNENEKEKKYRMLDPSGIVRISFFMHSMHMVDENIYI